MTIKNDSCTRGVSLADLRQIAKLLNVKTCFLKISFRIEIDENHEKYNKKFVLLIFSKI